MSEIKATSFRINEDDIAKFKEFADKEGYNQAEAFKSIMQTVEMARAKNMIKDRAKEIEVFQDTINNLMSMFLNSLNVNQTSEERIREELSQELQTKDNTISNLYEQLQESKSENKVLGDNNKELDDKVTMFSDRSLELIEKYNTLEKQLQVSNRNNETLQEQLTEYKEYKNVNKQLQQELEKLNINLSNKDKTISELENNNKQLHDKIKNDSDMIDFYKSNNLELKENIKALDDRYDKQIENIKVEHDTALQEEIKNIIERLSSKHEVEIAKKDLEIQKLQNEIEQLKSKSHRTTTNNKKPGTIDK
ncbi:chromosome segregation ATPase [Clostridium beijerinckii]|uniref:hypothetical protein n=1 Tax=Clostridium beijerinckii TaxID=1520 RepID=UPI0014941AA8|nr:hypothetical protein [Clostridium beijerinckii]NOW87973.1 chromosome segregation ATPase [Clostridium beijerinckii]